MKLIIDFYKELDTFNLILFWGVIIVITLLLIFSIIMIHKNRQLEEIIGKNGLDIDDDDDLAIAKTTHRVENDINKTNVINNISYETNDNYAIKNVDEPFFNTIDNPITKENTTGEPTFVAEEHVMEEKKVIPVPTIEKSPEVFPELVVEKKVEEVKETITELPSENTPVEDSTPVIDNKKITNNYETESSKPMPYERNVLREMRSNQTSPIGITRSNDMRDREYTRAEELNKSLSRENPNREYLEEVSEKLAKSTQPEISRTAYEIQQEADAIISYDELMRKKDSIKTVDEEEAVISMDELIKREKERLYKITPEEKNDKFIDELKKFRSDL